MLARRCKKLTALFLALCLVTGMLGTGAVAVEEPQPGEQAGQTAPPAGAGAPARR